MSACTRGVDVTAEYTDLGETGFDERRPSR
jgi:hypothetical protein